MMLTAVSYLEVKPGVEEGVKEVFISRPKLVKNYPETFTVRSINHTTS